jgi:ubiquinone/menaquinone biosynthesis C-methylase UbiE
VPDHQFADVELASLYDVFYPWDSREDMPFYLPFVMAAESALDLGCGTGMLLKRARDEGHTGRLCGLDPAMGMLEQARKRKDVEWILGDLSTVVFDGEFDFVVMTGHAFQVLVTDDEVFGTLESVRKALKPGGRFGFETRNPTVREWEEWTEERIDGTTTDDGIDVLMRNSVGSVEEDLVSFTTTYDSPSWQEPRQSRSTLRFLGVESLNSFISDAGLVVVEQYGDWDRSPLNDKSPEIITIAGRGM